MGLRGKDKIGVPVGKLIGKYRVNEDRVAAEAQLEAWRELLFFDQEAWLRERRDPVAPAQRSEPAPALRKARTKKTDTGGAVHSFRTLIAELGRITLNTCRRKRAPKGESTFTITTSPSDLQRRALQLLDGVSSS